MVLLSSHTSSEWTLLSNSNKFLKEGRHYSSAYYIRLVCVGGETWKKIIGEEAGSIQILRFSLNKIYDCLIPHLIWI